MTEAPDRDWPLAHVAKILHGGRLPAILIVGVVAVAFVSLTLVSYADDSSTEVSTQAARVSAPGTSVEAAREAEAASAIARLRKELGGALRHGLARGPEEAV
jgi:hypothetical protein